MKESTLTSWTPVTSPCWNLKRWKAAHNVKKPHILGWDCRGAGIISRSIVVLVVEKTLPLTSKRVCKIQFMSEICNHDPMFTLEISGLRVDISKSVIIKSWNKVWGQRTEVPKFEQSKNIHLQTFFPTTPNLSTATDDIRSPNTMSSVTFSWS